MSAQLPEPEGTDKPASRLARQVDIAARLAEIGLEMAEAIGRHVQAVTSVEAEGSAGEDGAALVLERMSLAYARVSRATRLSLMLQQKLGEAPRAAAAPVAVQGGVQAGSPVQPQLAERKARIERIVQRVAAREGDFADDQDIRERLDEDLCGEILNRPVSELVALICQDLELDCDWTRLAKEAWAQDEMAAGPVGWPLAGLAAPPLDDEADPDDEMEAGDSEAGDSEAGDRASLEGEASKAAPQPPFEPPRRSRAPPPLHSWG